MLNVFFVNYKRIVHNSFPMSVIPDRTPLPSRTSYPLRTNQTVNVWTVGKESYEKWLIIGMIASIVILLSVIFITIFLRYRKSESKVYADEDDLSDDDYAGKATVLNVYKLRDN